MTETPDRIAILREALGIITVRGWCPKMSTDASSPLNIRSAIAYACTKLVGHSNPTLWHELYLDGVHAVGTALRSGVTDWEAKVQQPSEVEAMLADVINRLENGDIKPRAGRRRARTAGL